MTYRINGKQVTKEEFLKGGVGFNFSSGAAPAIKKPICYVSPMSGKEITDYAQRKAEMKKYNVREVAPEEYNNKIKDLGFYDRRHPE